MRWGRLLGTLALAAGSLIGQSALAADWQVAAVSGAAYRLEGKAWVRVATNDEIALGQMVKTLGSGTLTLKRAGVTVAVAPNSRILLSERLQGKVTDVLQTAGSAEVKVDPGKHLRLSVETPFMAAAVKGTVFTVSTYGDHSQAFVKRGRVAVVDVKNHLTADITQGQLAASGPSQKLALSGVGTLEVPKPFKGEVYSPAVAATLTVMTSEQSGTADNAGSDSTSGSSNSSSGSSNSGDSSSGDSDSDSSDSDSSNSGDSNSGNSGNGNSNSGGSSSGHFHSGGGHSGHGGGNGHGGPSGHGNSGHWH